MANDSQMTNDPASYLKLMYERYKQTEFYKHIKNQMLNGMAKGAINGGLPSKGKEFDEIIAAILDIYFNQFLANISRVQNSRIQCNNPIDYIDSVLKQYTQSPSVQYLLKEALTGAGATAAAGGFSGGQQDLQNRAEIIAYLIGSDMQNYFEQIFAVQNMGAKHYSRPGI